MSDPDSKFRKRLQKRYSEINDEEKDDKLREDIYKSIRNLLNYQGLNNIMTPFTITIKKPGCTKFFEVTVKVRDERF